MNKWIDIELEQPQLDFEVLVSVDDDVFLAVYRELSDGSCYFDNASFVTHWMDKPEPFNKDKEQ